MKEPIYSHTFGGYRGRDRMVVGFTTTYAIRNLMFNVFQSYFNSTFNY
jgi:hypothetical protein